MPNTAKAKNSPLDMVEGEGADLLHATNGHVLDVAFLAELDQVVVDLARAKHHALWATRGK